MIYRQFGQTGREVSALGMGCMRFENPEDIEGSAQTVLRAVERGVTYIDTAPYYCNDRSEPIVGLAVRELQRAGKSFCLASKTMESRPDDIRRQLETSLERLNVDAIDFYHVWCLVHPHQLEQRKRDGALDAFRRLKEEGLIRHVCVSTHLSHDQIGAMLDQGEGLFEGMLLGLNAVNFPLRLQGAAEAAGRGLGVVTMNTLGGGLIMEHADQFATIRRPGDTSVLQSALRFNLSLPEVTVALVGFRNVADVDSAVDALEASTLLSPEELTRMKSDFLATRDDLCTQCNYCKDCPEDIPVMRYMEAYNRYLLNPDNPADILSHLRLHWGIPDVVEGLAGCTQCRHCEKVCTQHLPILERFETLRGLRA